MEIVDSQLYIWSRDRERLLDQGVCDWIGWQGKAGRDNEL